MLDGDLRLELLGCCMVVLLPISLVVTALSGPCNALIQIVVLQNLPACTLVALSLSCSHLLIQLDLHLLVLILHVFDPTL